ncbi:hypothetical protein AAVH_26681 [Aphelenchoides avenae]|nr:hypothetical protein AAVH_26680 [Aphelenchus avenae]KAH7706091.1 hypothetical protein AAVH_26681 [Aphelenchus avenae]
MPHHTDHSKNDNYWREFFDPCQFDGYHTDTDTESSSDESWGGAPGTPLRAQSRGFSWSPCPSPPANYDPRFDRIHVFAAVTPEDDQLIFVSEWLERRFGERSLEWYFVNQRREVENTLAVQLVKDTLTMQWDLIYGLSTRTAHSLMPGDTLTYEAFFRDGHARHLDRPYLQMAELASGIFRPVEMLAINRDTPYPPLILGPNEAV